MEIESGNHAELERWLGHMDRIKRTPMIWGTFAIGKSTVMARYGSKKAQEIKRKFVVWHELNNEYRIKLYQDREELKKVYILYDNRAASNDMTDDKGLPNILQGLPFLTWIQNLAYNVFALPEARGILFNDEFSIAPTMVQNSMLKMILDRSVGDIAFNPHILIACAGNRLEDHANVQDSPMPLRTRMGHFQLRKPTPEEQIEFYIQNGYDPRLIGFFRLHRDMIFYWDEDDEEVTACTPRTTQFLSEAIEPLDHTRSQEEKRDIELLACGFISTMVGKQFMKFLETTSSIPFDQILKNPSKAEKLQSLDQQYGLLTLLSSHFSSGPDPERIYEASLDIYEYLPEEIGILLFRMLKGSERKRPEIERNFGRLTRASDKCRKIFRHIAPFILEDDA